MTSETPAHDFLLPRLNALMAEAETAGIVREVAVAVLTDLVTGPDFNDAVPDPQADSAPRLDHGQGGADAGLLLAEKNNLVEQAIAPSGYL